MNKFIAVAVLFAAWAYAQTCIVSAPPAPPNPREMVVKFTNPDGGCRPCVAVAVVNNGARPNEYPQHNAKCDNACAIARQAAANDNGWDDGGVP
jgi:hypothetical protein